MDGLNLIVDKLSRYNLVTNILPGSVLFIILKYYIGYSFGEVMQEWFLVGIISYFLGIITNRFGSLCIEPLLKRLKIVVCAPYYDFVKAEQKDPKITTLNMENNAFRSYISVCILSLLAYAFQKLTNICPFICKYQTIVFVVLLLVLFIAAYRKQTAYIRKRVEILVKAK